jgi:hypothetical protein
MEDNPEGGNERRQMVGESIIRHRDGTATYGFDVWPGFADVLEYGNLEFVPLPEGIALFLGRIIVHSALVETRLKSLVRGLTQANGTTLDYKVLSKYGQWVTRLQDEARLLETTLPASAELLGKVAESTREMHRARGNLAHGEIKLELNNAEFRLVAISKHGTSKFTQAELRDLALRMSRALCGLAAALDPDVRNVPRSTQETQTLRDFLANNRQLDPGHSMKQPRPHHSWGNLYG